MFGWMVKKFSASEVYQDLNGLNSLAPQVRLMVATKIASTIWDSYDMYEEGASLTDIQQVITIIRREKCAGASGYNDPNHLICSLPEHFFISFSSKLSPSEANARRKLIFNALKEIISNDGWALLAKNDAVTNINKVKELEKKLGDNLFL